MENIEDIDTSGCTYKPNHERFYPNGTTYTYKAHRTKIAVTTRTFLEKVIPSTLKEERRVDRLPTRSENPYKLRKEEAGAILWVSCLRPQMLLKEIKSFIVTYASRHIEVSEATIVREINRLGCSRKSICISFPLK